ncbi:MAG: DUF1156 domain-containing protein, partial [bacterium]
MSLRKKLIEVALPLEAINVASAREKSIRHGHPSTLHLWWARRPLAACRAIIFASLVDDPSSRPDVEGNEEEQDKERERLFAILRELVTWENTTNEVVLEKARQEILKSTDGNPPPILDPFCGGGSIPLEAQRLGLKAYASDLNPVAVLITKALIEIPPKFANLPPVNSEDSKKKLPGEGWKGASGLAADVRSYGKWMRDEAEKRIGHLYPKVKLPKEQGGGEATVIAWLWARTVRCPNPACGAQMPLVRSFWLSTKKGKQTRLKPIVDKKRKTVRFQIESGEGEAVQGTKERGKATCLYCGVSSITDLQLRQQASSHGFGNELLGVVAEGARGRVYVEAAAEMHPKVAEEPDADWLRQSLPINPRWFSPPGYGLKTFRDLFTSRQLVALTTFSDLVSEARESVLADARLTGMPDDGKGIEEGGKGATAYADAVATYLGFAVDKAADYWSGLCSWHTSGEKMRNTFARQALPMVWDYAECCPFSSSTGNWTACVAWVRKVVARLAANASGEVRQLDACVAVDGISNPMVATDPPYYDNIGYADLSDFFYVWLRRSIGQRFPTLFSTLLTPKSEELIASPYRHEGSKGKATAFFEEGLAKAFERMRKEHAEEYPLTLFYAFKQAETQKDGDTVSTGWETMLEGLLGSGFMVTGTWPIRSELINRPVASGTNALASSVA